MPQRKPVPPVAALLTDVASDLYEAAGDPRIVRAPIWEPLPPRVPRLKSPQQLAVESQADELFFGGAGGGGKRLWIGTPVPVPLSVSPTGFKDHGDLRPGDFVYGLDGRPTLVVARLPVVEDSDAYEVEFSTGEVILADGDHLWATWTPSERSRIRKSSESYRSIRRVTRTSRAVAVSKKPWVSRTVTALNRSRGYVIKQPRCGIRTTREIAASLVDRNGALMHAVSVAGPIAAPTMPLPIEPYLFGLWLGDGISRAPSIGMLADDWQELSVFVPPSTTDTLDTAAPRKRPFLTKRFAHILKSLRTLGVFANKHIPPIYLRACYADRLSLLQGILDTDGSCAQDGQISIGLSNERLARDVHELVSSLGAKTSLRMKRIKRPAKDSWQMQFSASFVAFRLQRKARLQRLMSVPRTSRRYIVRATPVRSVPMCCIKVANDDGIYLVGRSFIPTHNTDLLIGLAATAHRNSVIFRRETTQFAGAEGMIERSRAIVGIRGDFNGSTRVWRNIDGFRSIEFGAVSNEKDRDKWRGRPHDLKAFDELPQFSESLYRFLIGWLRTSVPGQRTRVVSTGNPPDTEEGQWVIKYWGPWLDKSHPNPADPGELRYFAVVDGKDVERPDGEPFWSTDRDGKRELIRPRSRTFIPARVEDNPYYMNTGYVDVLNALPEPLRSQMRHGNFQAQGTDHPWQVIPSAWVTAAQERWAARYTDDHGPLTAVGADPSRGGSDMFSVAKRRGAWIDPLVKHSPKEAPTGDRGASLIFGDVGGDRHGPIQVDVIGTAGGSVYDHCVGLGLRAVAMNGSAKSFKRDRSGKLGFANKRAEWHWNLREALDPSLGADLCLPPDPQLRADLCAPRWRPTPQGIRVELKEEIVKRIGRSPNDGDAVIYACADEFSVTELDFATDVDESKLTTDEVNARRIAAEQAAERAVTDAIAKHGVFWPGR